MNVIYRNSLISYKNKLLYIVKYIKYYTSLNILNNRRYIKI